MPATWKPLAGFSVLVPHPPRAIACLYFCMLAAVSWFAPALTDAQAKPATGAEFQDLASALTIERGRTCLDSGDLVEHVTSWLGTERVVSPLQIEVQGSPYFARTVWFRIRRGRETLAERRFDPAPARCADLHAAVGLAIALALKASLLDDFLHARSLGDAHHTRFAVQGIVGIAVIPDADFGLSLSLQHWFSERFAARLTALGLHAPFGNFQDDQGRFRTWLGAGRLDLCSRIADLSGLDISACVGVAAGALYATGEAFPMSREALVPYVSIANTIELDINLSDRWSLTTEIDVLVPLRRTTFAVRDEENTVLATHHLAAAGALIAIGPAYHF